MANFASAVLNHAAGELAQNCGSLTLAAPHQNVKKNLFY
jgi:hypothetical protein